MKTNELLSGDDKKPWFRWVLGGFLVWTLLLSITTLNIQHSCSPMIDWQSTSPEYCSDRKSGEDFGTDSGKGSGKDSGEDSGKDSKLNPDVTGVVAGVASVVGLVILAPAAPIALVAGVGIMVWFTVRSALNH